MRKIDVMDWLKEQIASCDHDLKMDAEIKEMIKNNKRDIGTVPFGDRNAHWLNQVADRLNGYLKIESKLNEEPPAFKDVEAFKKWLKKEASVPDKNMADPYEETLSHIELSRMNEMIMLWKATEKW